MRDNREDRAERKKSITACVYNIYIYMCADTSHRYTWKGMNIDEDRDRDGDG